MLEPWAPTVKYCDFLGDALELPDAAFIPMSLMIPVQIRPSEIPTVQSACELQEAI
ncbi:MAG: hypothetical protein U0V87_05025 [Acidobacteriota bacterium]